MSFETKEREAQKEYWVQHSTQPTVEAMMLDSKAAEIDQLERPEVVLLPFDAVVMVCVCMCLTSVWQCRCCQR
jgi:hypothetical protein